VVAYNTVLNCRYPSIFEKVIMMQIAYKDPEHLSPFYCKGSLYLGRITSLGKQMNFPVAFLYLISKINEQ